MVLVFLAEGFEEIEALAPVDILRRAGIPVKTVGVGSKTVTGSHGITVVCDETGETVDDTGITGVVLPGGMPGTVNLEKSPVVQRFIDIAVSRGIVLGAICAAPSVLGHKGLLKGRRACCFTGYEKELEGAVVLEAPTVTDGNIVTGCGAGAALDFGFALLTALMSDSKKSDSLRASMKYK